ncbi:MAG: metallophosphoesterase [Candidatus Hadarchaeales archaeon]
MEITPVPDVPALKIKGKNERVLVVTDLHIGIEWELSQQGVSLPSQLPKLKKRLLNLIKGERAKRLIFLGDIKHNIPVSSWQEWGEIPRLLEELSGVVEVEIIPGNHDGDIKGMVPKDVVLHDVRGVTLGEVGLVHGHAWPKPELFQTEVLVTGHDHPAVEFRDSLGGRIFEKVWLRGKLNVKKLPKKIRGAAGKEAPQFLVVPAFSELVGGAAVNGRLREPLVGPFFRSGAVDLNRAEIYLLDGTFLGEVRNLRKLTVSPKETIF